MRSIGNKQGLVVAVFRHPLGDCTNNGISAGSDALMLYGATLEGHISMDEGLQSPHAEYPLAVLVPGTFPGYVKIIPMSAFIRKRQTMFGGNFAHSSDSRFSRAVEAITGAPCYGPVPIHDRFEG